MMRRTPRSTHFPYTTLFRSVGVGRSRVGLVEHVASKDCRFAVRQIIDSAYGIILDSQLPGSEYVFPGISARSEEHTSNSSHSSISYAVFCLKKKTNNYTIL